MSDKYSICNSLSNIQNIFLNIVFNEFTQMIFKVSFLLLGTIYTTNYMLQKTKKENKKIFMYIYDIDIKNDFDSYM